MFYNSFTCICVYKIVFKYNMLCISSHCTCAFNMCNDNCLYQDTDPTSNKGPDSLVAVQMAVVIILSY